MHIYMIVSYKVPLNACVIGAYVPYWLTQLMMSVTRINSLETARLPRVAALKIHLVYLGENGLVNK